MLVPSYPLLLREKSSPECMRLSQGEVYDQCLGLLYFNICSQISAYKKSSTCFYFEKIVAECITVESVCL